MHSDYTALPSFRDLQEDIRRFHESSLPLPSLSSLELPFFSSAAELEDDGAVSSWVAPDDQSTPFSQVPPDDHCTSSSSSSDVSLSTRIPVPIRLAPSHTSDAGNRWVVAVIHMLQGRLPSIKPKFLTNGAWAQLKRKCNSDKLVKLRRIEGNKVELKVLTTYDRLIQKAAFPVETKSFIWTRVSWWQQNARKKGITADTVTHEHTPTKVFHTLTLPEAVIQEATPADEQKAELARYLSTLLPDAAAARILDFDKQAHTQKVKMARYPKPPVPLKAAWTKGISYLMRRDLPTEQPSYLPEDSWNELKRRWEGSEGLIAVDIREDQIIVQVLDDYDLVAYRECIPSMVPKSISTKTLVGGWWREGGKYFNMKVSSFSHPIHRGVTMHTITLPKDAEEAMPGISAMPAAEQRVTLANYFEGLHPPAPPTSRYQRASQELPTSESPVAPYILP